MLTVLSPLSNIFLPSHSLSCCTMGDKKQSILWNNLWFLARNFTIIMYYTYALLPLNTSLIYANSWPATITIYIWYIPLPFYTEISARFVFKVLIYLQKLTSLFECTHANRGNTHVAIFTQWNSSYHMYVYSQLLNKDRIKIWATPWSVLRKNLQVNTWLIMPYQ